MPVIKFFGHLRQITGAAPRQAVGETVGAILEAVCFDLPALTQALFTLEPPGAFPHVLKPHVRVMVNGRDIELAQGLATLVQEEDLIVVFPPIAGG